MQQDTSTEDATLSFASYVPGRFKALIWSCLDASLPKSAAFYAERYYSLDRSNHIAKHLYATSLLRCGQIHSAMNIVNLTTDQRCSGCSVIKAECCTMLGRHGLAGEALEKSLTDPGDVFGVLDSERPTKIFPEKAVLYCRIGKEAMKANLQEKAVMSFRKALELNPMLWEAFEGLCVIGSFPEIEEIFPSRPQPVKQGPEDMNVNVASSSKLPASSGPIATGLGFFTPDVHNQNGLRAWMPDPAPPQPFRMAPPVGGRDSMTTNDSFFMPDNSLVTAGHHLRSRQLLSSTILPPRPLSSAEEAGPVPKKPRSHSRAAAAEQAKSTTAADTRIRKPAASSRTTRGEAAQAPGSMASRKSKRLLSGGAGEAQKSHVVKHPPARKRPANHGRSKSTESEMDEDSTAFGDAAMSPSPPPVPQSPRSEGSPLPPSWTPAQEQAALDAYYCALADNYIYDLMRLFASAIRALAMYDCDACLEELDQLPEAHQRSSSVMAMVGRARYEMADYMKAERFFHAARSLDPYRLTDMEVYSTCLWHLQKGVQLSFLAQELLSIDPRSPQAWIAVGNCFSLQKERSQALTCFRRAAQLDPSCAYAYTLSGHESTEEDLDKAVSFFQSALRADPRHYNAWYGLGTCFLRQSKIRLAEFHYRKAASIHPSNAVLLGCVGMAVERRGDRDEAFALFNQAVHLAPDNALVRYRRAKILIATKDYQGAITDLERLRDSSPEEANVVFQLARVYRLIGDIPKATQMLAVARDMSPKSLNKIKRLLAADKEATGEVGEDEMDEG